MPLDINDPVGCSDLIKVYVHSSNLRAEMAGINEIRNFYMQVWKEAEDADIWEDRENVMFGELCYRDCVARCHLIVVEE